MSSEETITVTAQGHGQRADAYLASRLPEFSRARIQKLMETGSITRSGVPLKPRDTLHTGDTISLTHPAPVEAQPQPQDIPLDIVYQDEHLFVINKPVGLTVHPGAGQADGTLVNALLFHADSLSSVGGVLRPGIVHRLDKDTSGLILVARTDAAHRQLATDLEARRIQRTYWALALRRFETDNGTVDAEIGRHPSDRVRMSVVTRGGRHARTHYSVIEKFGNVNLVECRLETGRTHQIRVHLSHIRHPILGDDIYGGSANVAAQLVARAASPVRAAIAKVSRQMLHARKLTFVHPVDGRTMEFLSEPPEDFQQVLAALRQASEPTA